MFYLEYYFLGIILITIKVNTITAAIKLVSNINPL